MKRLNTHYTLLLLGSIFCLTFHSTETSPVPPEDQHGLMSNNQNAPYESWDGLAMIILSS